MASQIFTIGYEGADIADFTATLVEAGVLHLFDVREIAHSRRRGFSKTALQALLASQDIQYTHFRKLGDPKEGREAAKRGDYDKFRKIFMSHLSSTEAQAELAIAAQLALSTSVCLLCFERDQNLCHRTIVASAMASMTGQHVTALGVREGIAKKHEFRRNLRGDRIGQSRPPHQHQIW